MPNINNHLKCPRCKGEGFYLAKHGHGFYRDGSFGHNIWNDCNCHPYMKIENLPKVYLPKGDI